MQPDAILMRCSACGATNRVPRGKLGLGRAPRCGRCKMPLPPIESEPVPVSDATFGELVERSALPVLLDAWAPWCAPCRQLAPIVDALAGELAGRVRVAKLDIDESPRTAARLGLQSIPTLLIFKDGREIDRVVGAQPKAEISRRLERVLR